MKSRGEQDPRVIFGRAVRKRRLAKAISQEELAAQAGIHRNYAGSVERGERNVAILNMVKLANALSVPLSELVKGL